MKTLVLVRHGKSSRSHSGQEEIDRSLTHRGKRDSEHMAEQFHDLGLQVHAVISSPAVRAKASARYFADHAVLPVEVDERLYNAHEKDLMDIVHGLDGSRETVVLIGHNPGMSEFLCRLLGHDQLELSSAAVAVINFDVPEWRDITEGRGKVKWFQNPKTVDEQRWAA